MKANVKQTNSLKNSQVVPKPGLKNPKSIISSKKTDDETKEVLQATKGLEKHEKQKQKDKAPLVKSAVERKNTKGKLPKISPYAMCLLSPFEYHASQIPDSVTFPSCCLNLTYKGSITATNQNVPNGLGNSFAICIGSNYTQLSPYYNGGNLLPMRGVGSSNFYFGSTVSGLGTPSSYMFNSATATGLQSTVWGSFQSANVQLCRIVSCAVRLTLTGPVLLRQGTLVGGSFPRQGISDGGSLGGVTYETLLNSPNAVTVNAVEQSIQSNYSPTDNVSYEYLDPSNTYATSGPAWRDNRGELWIVGVGLQPGETADYQVTMGIEFIPSTSILDLVDATPSFAHSNQMDQAENLTACVPKVFGVDYDESWGSATMDVGEQTHLPSSLSKLLTTQKSGSGLKNVNEVLTVHSSNGVSKFLDDIHDSYRKGKSLLKEIMLDVRGLWSQFAL